MAEHFAYDQVAPQAIISEYRRLVPTQYVPRVGAAFASDPQGVRFSAGHAVTELKEEAAVNREFADIKHEFYRHCRDLMI